MSLTTKTGSLSTRLRDSPRARYLSAGAIVAISAVSVPAVSGMLSPTQKVMVAAADLPAGHVLTRSDFTLADADASPSYVIPAAEMTQMIGKTLHVEVPKNTLLATGDFGTYPPAGMAEVAFKVTPGTYPPQLAAGQRVAVIPPDPAQSAAQPAAAATPNPPVVGQVLSITPEPNANDGGSVVVLLVPIASAAAVTAAQGGSLVGLDANGDAS